MSSSCDLASFGRWTPKHVQFRWLVVSPWLLKNIAPITIMKNTSEISDGETSKTPRYEPGSLGLEGQALTAVLEALQAWAGGLLVATQKATEQGTWERWSLEDIGS